MPKTPVDYAQTAIYKIVCKDLAVKDMYVGSTTSIVKRRFSHKSRCANPAASQYNYKVYQCIRKTGGWSNWELVLVESFPCTTGEEQRMRERHWLEVLGANLNSMSPIVTEIVVKPNRKFIETEYIKAAYGHDNGNISFNIWFATTFNSGQELNVSKREVDKLITMDALAFRRELERSHVEFTYESQERLTIDGVREKGFYHGFGLK